MQITDTLKEKVKENLLKSALWVEKSARILRDSIQKPEKDRSTRYCFIDVETTGLDPTEHEIIEIALIRTDGQFSILDKYETKILPRHIETASKKALEINGYDPDVWEAEAVSLEEALETIDELLEDAIPAGQNTQFDLGFLKAAYRSLEREVSWYNYHSLDTASLAVPLMMSGKIKGLSLRRVCAYLGVINQAPHRAYGDVLATMRVAQILTKMYRHSIPL